MTLPEASRSLPAWTDRDEVAFRRRTALGAAVLVALLACLVAGARIAWVGQAPADGSGGTVAERTRALVVVATACAVASLGGWLLPRLGATDPALAVSRSLAGVALRLLLPLALLGALSAPREAWPEAATLREAGAAGVLVVFYLSLLATDILLNIMWGPKGPRRPPRTRRPAPEPPTG